MHRAHDYRMAPRALARRCQSRRAFGCEGTRGPGGFRSAFSARRRSGRNGGIYLSAGIHGDEPAATEALLEWAALQGPGLREIPLLIFPCLNPWGLQNNVRVNTEGIDLNRSFDRTDLPEINAQRALIAAHTFDLAINLHEDYDGEGLYLYEIQRESPNWGEPLIRAAREVIPIEERSRVDGRQPEGGLIRRRIDYRRFDRIGHPEAIWLHRHHSRRSFTVETPSEFALEQRVAAHVAVLREAHRLFNETATAPSRAAPSRRR